MFTLTSYVHTITCSARAALIQIYNILFVCNCPYCMDVKGSVTGTEMEYR